MSEVIVLGENGEFNVRIPSGVHLVDITLAYVILGGNVLHLPQRCLMPAR